MHAQPLALFVILACLAVIPFLARRLRTPSAALEILFGVLLFNTFFDQRPEWFELLRELGFIYLMFIAGMELDLRALRLSGHSPWFLLAAALSFCLTPLVFWAAGLPVFLGIAVAMISAGIVIPVLKELDLEDSRLGRSIIGLALTGELLSILVLTFIDIAHVHGLTWQGLLALGKLILLFGLALLVLRLLYLLAWWHPQRVAKVMESEDPVEEGLRVVVTVAFAGGVLASAAGAEAILGSFLGGMIFSHVFRARARFEGKVHALGFGFLVPFFFLGVGAQLDVRQMFAWQPLLQALGLTMMVGLSNLSVLLLLKPLALSLREGLAMTALLSAPLSMIVVAGTLGQKMGLVSVELGGALVLTALLASVLYPSLFRLLVRSADREDTSANPARQMSA